MIIQPTFPGGYVVFSDDIRHEVSQKVTIVGAYYGEMNVAAMPPILIPQLCISINYRDDIATFPKDVVVIVTQKGSEVLELARFAFSLPAPDSPIINDPLLDEGSVMFGEMRMEARISPFHVIENCRINVRAYVGGDEIRLGSLAVRLNPPPEPDTLKTE